MCRSEDTHPLTFAARTGLTKNKHVPVRSFLFERTSTNESSKLPKYPETDPFISPLAYIRMDLQLKAYIILGWEGELVSVKSLSRLIHKVLLERRKVIGLNFNYHGTRLA